MTADSRREKVFDFVREFAVRNILEECWWEILHNRTRLQIFRGSFGSFFGPFFVLKSNFFGAVSFCRQAALRSNSWRPFFRPALWSAAPARGQEKPKTIKVAQKWHQSDFLGLARDWVHAEGGVRQHSVLHGKGSGEGVLRRVLRRGPAMGFTVKKGSEKRSQKGFWEGSFQKVPRTTPWGVRPLRRAP